MSRVISTRKAWNWRICLGWRVTAERKTSCSGVAKSSCSSVFQVTVSGASIYDISRERGDKRKLLDYSYSYSSLRASKRGKPVCYVMYLSPSWPVTMRDTYAYMYIHACIYRCTHQFADTHISRFHGLFACFFLLLPLLLNRIHAITSFQACDSHDVTE